MSSTELRKVAEAAVHEAEKKGFITSKDVRALLAEAGHEDAQWKEVIALAGPSLRIRQGRYYYLPPGTDRLQQRMRDEKRQKKALHQAVKQLIRRYQVKVIQNERRMFGRIPFVQPVTILADDEREIHCVSRDISLSGIRVLGTRNLLGQKVRMFIPNMIREGQHSCFVVQFLWSARIGDDLTESGGFFVDLQSHT